MTNQTIRKISIQPSPALKTSISLEPAFERAMKEIATERGTTFAQLVREIMEKNEGVNLSSSCRLFVLAHYRDMAAQHERKVA